MSIDSNGLIKRYSLASCISDCSAFDTYSSH